MRLKIFFFAELKVKMNREFIEADFRDVKTIRDLQKHLEDNFGELKGCFSDEKLVKTALNHEYCSIDTELNHGDEVAFFPPVTGG